MTAVKQSQSLEIYHHPDFSVECFASYLKQQNCSDDYLNSITTHGEVFQACQNGVYIEKENLLAQALLTLRFKENFVCIQNGLQHNENFKNLLLNVRVAKSTLGDIMQQLSSIITGKKTPKEKAVERIEKQLRDILSTVEVKCALSVDFAKLFDSFFEQNREEFSPYEDVQEYCIKNELEVNQVINLEQFRITLDPKLKFDHIACSQIFESLKFQTFETFKGDFDVTEMLRRPCVLAVLNEDNDYFYLLLKAELISKYSLPRERRNEERENFVDKMIEITMKVREKC